MQFHHIVYGILLFKSLSSIVVVVHCWTTITSTTKKCKRLPTTQQWSIKRLQRLLPAYTTIKIDNIVSSSLYSQQYGSTYFDTNNSTIVSATSLLQSNSYNITLRNATLDDLSLLLYWDEKDHLQHRFGIDIELNDWNWEYELPRNDLSN
jgi:hypothetical protein